MKNLRNSVQLIGNLGLDPEVITTTNGNKLAKISLATNDSYINADGEKIQQTQWHQLIAWGKKADIAEKFLSKGKEIAVEGKLTHRSYDDKEGKKRFITEVVVNDLLMLGSK